MWWRWVDGDQDRSTAGQLDDGAMRRALEPEIDPVDITDHQELARQQAVAVLGAAAQPGRRCIAPPPPRR